MGDNLVLLSVGLVYKSDKCHINKRVYGDVAVKNKIIVYGENNRVKIEDLGKYNVSPSHKQTFLLNPTKQEILEHTMSMIDLLESYRVSKRNEIDNELNALQEGKQKVLAEMEQLING